MRITRSPAIASTTATTASVAMAPSAQARARLCCERLSTAGAGLLQAGRDRPLGSANRNPRRPARASVVGRAGGGPAASPRAGPNCIDEGGGGSPRVGPNSIDEGGGASPRVGPNCIDEGGGASPRVGPNCIDEGGG